MISFITGHTVDLILSSVISIYYQSFFLTSLYTYFSFDYALIIVLKIVCGKDGETKNDVIFFQERIFITSERNQES